MKVQHRPWNLLSKRALVSNVVTVLGSPDTRLKPLREILSLCSVKKKCFISLTWKCVNNNVSFSLQSTRQYRAKSEEVLLRKLTSFLTQLCLPVFLFFSFFSYLLPVYAKLLFVLVILDLFFTFFCIHFNCLNTLFFVQQGRWKDTNN